MQTPDAEYMVQSTVLEPMKGQIAIYHTIRRTVISERARGWYIRVVGWWHERLTSFEEGGDTNYHCRRTSVSLVFSNVWTLLRHKWNPTTAIWDCLLFETVSCLSIFMLYADHHYQPSYYHLPRYEFSLVYSLRCRNTVITYVATLWCFVHSAEKRKPNRSFKIQHYV